MSEPPAHQQPNTLGNTSLILGIASAALVFGIGLCALTGVNQRWIQLAGTPLFVCGGASAFLGLLAALLGVAGLFGRNRSRATAIVGLVLGIIGACLFLIILNMIGRLR
jgi:riboflavin transporter FmnP